MPKALVVSANAKKRKKQEIRHPKNKNKETICFSIQ